MEQKPKIMATTLIQPAEKIKQVGRAKPDPNAMVTAKPHDLEDQKSVDSNYSSTSPQLDTTPHLRGGDGGATAIAATSLCACCVLM